MSRPGFYFCFCPDPGLIRMQISKILDSSGQKDWQIKTVWLDYNNDEEERDQKNQLWNALNLPGMTGPPRAVIVRKCHAEKKSQFWAELTPMLKGFKPDIWPFFCFESQWEKGKLNIPACVSKTKYFQFARKKGWIWEFQGLNPNNIQNYVNSRMTALNIRADGPEIVKNLCSVLPCDSAHINRELEKLALATHPENIIRKEHLSLISSQPEIDIFSFLQEIQRGQDPVSVWNKIFQEKLKNDDMLFGFLGLLLRETRILWLLATGQDQKVRLYPAVKRDKSTLAMSIGKEKISQLWHMIFSAELSVKSGRVDVQQAMEIITADLFKLFSGKKS